MIESHRITALDLYSKIILLYSSDFHETTKHAILHKLLLKNWTAVLKSCEIYMIHAEHTVYVYIQLDNWLRDKSCIQGLGLSLGKGLTDEAVQSIIQYVSAR